MNSMSHSVGDLGKRLKENREYDGKAEESDYSNLPIEL